MHVFGCDSDNGSAEPVDHLHAGGKALNLVRLCQFGFRVPPFFVLPASAFRHVIDQSREIRSLMNELSQADDESRIEKAAALREMIVQCQWPEDLVQDFSAAVEKLVAGETGQAPGLMAVRSSATDEDGDEHSFAGMHDSFLFVNGVEEVIEKTKRVWASAFNDRALAYRLGTGWMSPVLPLVWSCREWSTRRSPAFASPAIRPTDEPTKW